MLTWPGCPPPDSALNPTPEWGVMLAEGCSYLYLAPRLALASMVAMVTVTVVVTVLGRTLERRWTAETLR